MRGTTSSHAAGNLLSSECGESPEEDEEQDMSGTGDWHDGGRANGEYSMGLVDGGRGNEERRSRIGIDSDNNNERNHTRHAKEGDQSSRSVGLRQEGMDAVR